MCDQVFAQLGLLDLRSRRQHRLEAAVGADQLGRGFGADAGDARHIVDAVAHQRQHLAKRSEEHTSELQSLMRISYAVFCLKKKMNQHPDYQTSEMNTTHI